MRALKVLRLDDPHIIDLVDPHFSGGMNNFVSIEQDADMGDLPLFIVEKGQIAGARFFEESDCFALTGLLMRIA